MSALPILSLMKNGSPLKSVPVDREIDIGRDEACVIRLDDRAVSRRHARVSPGPGGQVSVRRESDVGAVLINGVECTEGIASPGDVIEIGQYRLRVERPESADAPRSVVERPVLTAPTPTPASTLALAPSPEAPSIAVSGGEPAFSSAFELEAGPAAPERTSELVHVQAPIDELPGNTLLSPADTPTASVVDEPIAGGPNDPLAQLMPTLEAPPAFTEGTGLTSNVSEDAATRVMESSRVQARVSIEAGDGSPAREVEVTKDETYIGRDPECEILIEDKKLSRKHTLILRKGMSFLIKDLGSSNGTYLNGQKIEQASLSSGDEIKVGKATLRFTAESADYEKKAQSFMELTHDPLAPEGEPTPILSGGSQPPPASFLEAAPAAPLAGSGLTGLSGLAGAQPGPGPKASLVEKFKALPRRKQIVYALVAIGLAFNFLVDDDKPSKPAAKPKASASATPAAGKNVAFDALPPDKKKYVETQHALAFEHFRTREYDKSLFELGKIFALVNDYKDSREIERYAKEGKRKLEQIEEERKRREEETRLRARVGQLVEETRALMASRSYPQAKELFSEILALDPDNADVASWRKDIQGWEELEAAKAQARRVREELNQQGREIFDQGVAFRKQDKLFAAMSRFESVEAAGVTDAKLLARAAAQIREIRAEIESRRTPLLAAGKAAEDSGDLSAAYKAYQKAAEVDPRHPDGAAGMARVRSALNERNKQIYIEAVLAESYSDFSLAKRKYQQLLESAPSDDVYHQRAKRKLAGYFVSVEDAAVPAAGSQP